MSGMPINVDMSGFDRLLKDFDLLNRRMQQKVIGKAAREALDVMMPLAKLGAAGLPFLIPPSSKRVRFTLVKSIRKKTSNKRDHTVVTAFFDYKKGKAVKLAHLFEFGFNHVGGKRMPDYRFMSDAFETRTSQMQQVLAAKIRQHMDEAVKP